MYDGVSPFFSRTVHSFLCLRRTRKNATKNTLKNHENRQADNSSDDSDDDEDEDEALPTENSGILFENFRSDDRKNSYINRQIQIRSKWLASKIRENTEHFPGGLDLQGQIPSLKHKNIGKKNSHAIEKGVFAMGSIVGINDQFVKIYLYGATPAILTIKEVSDILSNEIDRLTGSQPVQTSKGLSQTLRTLNASQGKQRKMKRKASTSGIYESVSDLPSMRQLFKVNQLIRCVVTHRSKHPITIKQQFIPPSWHVSIRPSLFNHQLKMGNLCFLSLFFHF